MHDNRIIIKLNIIDNFAVGILISWNVGENLSIVYLVKQKMGHAEILPIKILDIEISHLAVCHIYLSFCVVSF